MDLQAVKLSPFIRTNAFYYKTKLVCHNFTVYNIVSHQSTAYWFSEIDSDLSASTFASLILVYLKDQLSSEKNIVIFSDGCTYQNRNAIMANALLNYCIENKCTIIQKFLERGHTQMECDSVHSLIERKLKNREVYLPSNYLTVTMEARKSSPYIAKWVTFDQFTNYSHSSSQRFSSLRPGQNKVTEIKALQYSPDGIQFKLDFEDDWTKLPQRIKNLEKKIIWPKLHTSTRKISSQKFNHLQQLKAFIPPDCHAFYDQLPHE
ncbi:uncharacterized protein LOC111060166 [Nilaparvata lugens]|nr:uncharacterized protein LOC111060166 [Nilaparvata lugens]